MDNRKKVEFGLSASDQIARGAGVDDKIARVAVSGDTSAREVIARVLDAVDYLEVKVITPGEARRFKELMKKPLFFHIQYSGNGGYYLPAVMDFTPHMPEISEAYRIARPSFLSIHFGLSSPQVSIDTESFVAVASAQPLGKEEILRYLETNLKVLKAAFPDTPLLIENVEFIPEAICKGAYRHVQEASFFSTNVTRWHSMGLLDGIIFDIAHALIVAGNHPYYNGLTGDPVKTGEDYIRKLKDRNDIFRYFETYISRMPLHLIREVHISGATRLPNGMWVDSHNVVGDTELMALKIVLEELKKKGVEYLPVTLEYSRDMENVIPQLTRLRDFFDVNF